MRVVCNASPVIFLSKIDRLDLLCNLFKCIYIPSAAWCEATAKPDDCIKNLQQLNAVEVFTVKNKTAVNAMLGRLHIGEVEVIVGAKELNLSTVILDDRYARNKAKQMGLSVIGTLGLLILARDNGYINNLSEDVDKLKAIGFRISDDILSSIL